MQNLLKCNWNLTLWDQHLYKNKSFYNVWAMLLFIQANVLAILRFFCFEVQSVLFAIFFFLNLKLVSSDQTFIHVSQTNILQSNVPSCFYRNVARFVFILNNLTNKNASDIIELTKQSCLQFLFIYSRAIYVS